MKIKLLNFFIVERLNSMEITMYKNYSPFGPSFSEVRILGKCQDKVSFRVKQDGENYKIYKNDTGNYIIKYLYDKDNYNVVYLHELVRGDYFKGIYLLLPQKDRYITIKCHDVEWEWEKL